MIQKTLVLGFAYREILTLVNTPLGFTSHSHLTDTDLFNNFLLDAHTAISPGILIIATRHC